MNIADLSTDGCFTLGCAVGAMVTLAGPPVLALFAAMGAGVCGSNGAGKSTLFHAITGSFFVDEGQIVLNGEDITYCKEHVRSRVIGHLFQDPLKATAPHMTIEENMAPAYLRASTRRHTYFGRISSKEKKKFQEQLSLLNMGLEDRMKQPVGLLSGGQRQALSLGNRTLMMDGGRIVFHVSGEERKNLTVDDLLEQFKVHAGKQLDNDRILLSK